MSGQNSHLFEINVSAPGKVILHGEHAVVLGKAAIAGSLDLRCHIKLKRTNGSTVSLQMPDIGISKEIQISSLQKELQHKTVFAEREPVPASEDVTSVLNKLLGVETGTNDSKQLAALACLYLYSDIFLPAGSPPSIEISIKSDLPVGAGLGSSAAFSVSLSAALLQLAGMVKCDPVSDGVSTWSTHDLDIINKWAFIGEKVIHGQPSGIDNSISTYGGALRFKKGEFTHVKSMPTLSVMLVNTKVPRSTKTLVSAFKHKYDTFQEICEPILSAMEAITEKAEAVLKSLKETGEAQCFDTLGDLMDMNQRLLNLMGVGHPSLDKIISIAKENGLQGKLTGAGGGGCALLLLPPSADKENLELLKERFEGLGFQVWSSVSFGGSGVQLHS